MKPLLPIRFIVSIGMFLLSGSLIAKHFFNIPDFADGLMKGLSIGLLILALIYQSKSKQAL